jgi:DNA (cytosine-5)-methyltransferase 1
MNRKLNFIDLFAGAGGLSEGFIRAGFEPIAHVEIDKAACFSLKTRTAYHYLKSINKYEIYKQYLAGKINRETLYSHVPTELLNSVINLPIGEENNKEIFKQIDTILKKRKVNFIIGGPPCQAYSLVGRARSENGMKGDKRNYLYVHYARFLEKYEPDMFVFENVLGLKSAGNGRYLNNMEKLFDKKGYHMKTHTVEANKFGVLQNRKRLIILGWRKDLDIELPNIESFVHEQQYAVKDLLHDLPKIAAGEGFDKGGNYAGNTNPYLKDTGIRNGIAILTQHMARPHTKQDKEIYRIAVDKWKKYNKRLDYNDLPERLKTHKNRHSFFDRFKVVADELPYSQTIVAHIAKDGHYYIHPDVNQNRSITVREAARLQSFPDDYYFEGVKEGANRTAAFKQIGNAVPPIMAYQIAKTIKHIF